MARSARLLLLFTMLYNVAEGVVAIWSGLLAHSLSLVAFGADSYIEVAAAGVVYWRLGAMEAEDAEEKERRAMRFIGWTLILLAVAVIAQSVWNIASQTTARESAVGIGLALVSLVVMPAIAYAKLRIARRHDIPMLAMEAKETLACSYLSGTLLIGLGATALWGWWWLDTATALLLTPWLIREGLEGIRGESHEAIEAG